MTTLESEFLAWWNANGQLRELVPSGMWRDEVPENDERGRKIGSPDAQGRLIEFGRFSLISQAQRDLQTAGPEGTQTGQSCFEDRLIQVDVWGTDPEKLRNVAEISKKHLNRWKPTLIYPEVFHRCDRTNWLFVPEDEGEWEGRTVWRSFQEFTVVVECEV